MKQNNIKVAITGGIGSGKSTVCEILKKSGYSVFSCDQIYAELFERGDFTEELKKAFGDVTDENNKLDRKKISAKVFSDEKKLQQLNNITHPKIFEEMFKRAEGYNLSFFEVPLLFEGGYENLFDAIIVVLREREKRILSASMRDKLSCEEIEKRIESQRNHENIDYSEYYVIHNDGNIDELKHSCDTILSELTKHYI